MPKRDWNADLALCNAATHEPWRITDPKMVRLHCQVVGREYYDGLTIIDAAPRSRAEAHETFFHAVLVGDMAPADAAFAAAAREGWPAAINEVLRLQGELRRMHALLQRACNRAEVILRSNVTRTESSQMAQEIMGLCHEGLEP